MLVSVARLVLVCLHDGRRAGGGERQYIDFGEE